MKILPRIKHYSASEGKFVFPSDNPTKISIDVRDNGCYVESFTKVFNDYFYQLTRSSMSCVDGVELISAKQIESDVKEYYEIDVNENSINIRYSCKLALRNAMATLISLTVKENKTVYINCAKIKDNPNFSHRSMLVDVARRYIPMDEFKMHIRTLGLCKYNYLHWHLSDNQYSYEVKCYPDLNAKSQRKLYTQEELKELVDYAQSFGIESIPEIDVPGHCIYLLSSMPEIFCDIVEQRDTDRPISKYAIYVSNPKTYEVLTNIIAELCTIFKGEYFHTGEMNCIFTI